MNIYRTELLKNFQYKPENTGTRTGTSISRDVNELQYQDSRF